MYYNLVKHLNGRPNLFSIDDDVYNHIDDKNDFYQSVYQYEEKHKDEITLKSSIAGITDVTTNRIVFDMDNKDLSVAQQDTITLIRKLLDLGIQKSQLRTYFSGSKGFHVEFDIDRRINPQQHKNFAIHIAKDLKSFDIKVYNAARFIRVPYTKHQDTHLYKTPLSLIELRDCSIEQILELAKERRHFVETHSKDPFHLDESWFVVQKEEKFIESINIDWSKKPRWLSNCRYALQNGMFKEGMRSNALSCLAATYKAQGFTKEQTTSLLESVTILQAQKNGGEPFDELNNVISPVYSEAWKGGIYTCKEEGWLKNYCDGLGEHSCNKTVHQEVVKVDNIYNIFENYVNDLDKNIIYTGINSLDKRIKFLVGTSNSFVGSPGVGKTAISLQLANYNSSKNINSLFFSYDMFHSALFIRMIQRHTGYTQDEIFNIYKNKPLEKKRIQELLNKEYKNVNFCFKAGQSIEDLEETIIETEQKIGDKLKLVIVDYNELVIAKSADPTQASAEVAQSLRRIANEKQVCIITLLQPSKYYSNPADEMTTHNSAKGSGTIAQSLTTMIGISRPGFNPLRPELDNYYTLTCLKNRNGGLFSLDMRWDGLKGSISELLPGDKEELEQIRQARDERKKLSDTF